MTFPSHFSTFLNCFMLSDRPRRPWGSPRCGLAPTFTALHPRTQQTMGPRDALRLCKDAARAPKENTKRTLEF